MKKILVPTEFSPIAHNAVMYALSLGKILKSEVIIFHADKHDNEDLSKLKEEVNKNTATEPSIKISYIISHKHFSSLTVNEVVKSHHIDLIIMGTVGEAAPLEKRIFGRETTEITEHADCPVIAVPSHYKFSGIKNIAYASDLNFVGNEIGKIIHFAKSLNAGIEVFHVSPIFPDLGDVEKINVNQKVNEIKRENGFTGIHYSVEKTKHDNEILKGIGSFINHYQADLLVMFHRHVSAFDEFISTSNTAKVISHIKTPVLIYPKV